MTTLNLNLGFESLRGKLLGQEDQEEIFGKSKKMEVGEEGFMGEVIGNFDNWLYKTKGQKKPEQKKK